jgi:hypothetical protein
LVKFPCKVSIGFDELSTVQSSPSLSPALLCEQSSHTTRRYLIRPLPPTTSNIPIPHFPHSTTSSLRPRPRPDSNATYGLLGEVSAGLADVLERVPLSYEEPLEIGRHLWLYEVGLLGGFAAQGRR